MYIFIYFLFIYLFSFSRVFILNYTFHGGFGEEICFTFIDTTPIRYWRGSIKKDHSVHFQLIKVCPKLCGNSNFPKNFHIRKLGEITVFYAVYIDIVFIKLKRLLNVFILLVRKEFYTSTVTDSFTEAFQKRYQQNTDFMPLVSFNTPWKHQKTKRFLIFSGGTERDQWYEMG